MSNNIIFLLQAEIVKRFTHYHFSGMNLGQDSEIYIGKANHRRRHSGLLERPVPNLPEDSKKIKTVSLRRRSLDYTRKNLNSVEQGRKSWEFADDAFERNVDLNKTYIGDFYFSSTPQVRVSPRGSKNYMVSENEVIKKYPKTKIRHSNGTREIATSVLEGGPAKVCNRKRRNSRRLKERNEDFNIAFIEEIENDEDKNILENIDISNFNSPVSLEKAIAKKSREREEVDDLNKIKRYYLNKTVKKRHSNLETIYEIPKKNNYMTIRKYKRFINFEEFNKKTKVEKRQLKAVGINPTLYKIDNIKVEKFDWSFEELFGFDECCLK